MTAKSIESKVIDLTADPNEMTSPTEIRQGIGSLRLPRCRLLLLVLVAVSGAALLLVANLNTPLLTPRVEKCPDYAYISADPRGRLGNNLAEYATIFAFALKYNLTAMASPQLLANMRYMVRKISLATVAIECVAGLKQILPEEFEEIEPSEMQAHSWCITYYPHHIRMFWKYRKELVQEFAFRPKLLQYADSSLHYIAHGRTNLTFVGVHVRRTDYAAHLKVVFNGTPVTEYFYKSAMELCRRRYTNPVFVLTSDDLGWCRWRLMASDVYVVGDAQRTAPGPEHDLAVLAACNHTIFDYGTFGFFGAFLAGGDIIIADGFSEKEHEIVTEFRLGGINATYLDPGGRQLDKCARCR